MDALAALAPGGGMIAASCAALGLSRASLHRRKRTARAARPRAKSGRALDANERRAVLDLLREPRFVDLAPAEIYACLLDEGVYLCSIRTMYRVLHAHDEVRERRRQLRHPVYQKPELLAEAPNQVWSWDITKLMGPAKWSYFISTSSSIFSAAGLSASMSRTPKPPRCSSRSSTTPCSSTTSHPASSHYMPIAARR